MAGLLVTVQCPACHRQTQVWMLGGWDIKSVRHDCDGERAFEVVFDPPRPVF